MRNFFAFLFMVTSLAALSQNETVEPLKNKKGVLLLPQTGEWGLGISASPLLQYTGNLLNGNTNNSGAAFNYSTNPASIGNNIAVFGKYVKNENTHYRARFNASVATVIDKVVLSADVLTPDPEDPAFTEDRRSTNSRTFILSAGIEKRRGSTRLQGFYGAEALLGYFGQSAKFEYGNSISADFTSPTSNNFGNNFNGFTSDGDRIRSTSRRTGNSLLIGARGFIGVEYFFAPRISLGGEFGYMISLRSNGKTVVETEQWSNTTNSILNDEVESYSSGPTTIGIGLDNLSGSINLLFYF
ncbi:MAG: hypothetical protein J0L67_16200 [Cytophagales bacterium]|nr:hypothetical protein [Cytophagales bacterium]